MILYFSATGNSKYVAERIAAAFDDTAVSIEKHLIYFLIHLCCTTKDYLKAI